MSHILQLITNMKVLLFIFGAKKKTIKGSAYATKVGRAGTTCEVAACDSATHTCWVQLGHGESVDLAWFLPGPLVWRFPALASSRFRLQTWSEVLSRQCAQGNVRACGMRWMRTRIFVGCTEAQGVLSILMWCVFRKFLPGSVAPLTTSVV